MSAGQDAGEIGTAVTLTGRKDIGNECEAHLRELAKQEGVLPEKVDDVVMLLTWPGGYCFTMGEDGRLESPVTDLPPAEVIRGLDFFSSGQTVETHSVYGDADLRNPLSEAARRVGIPGGKVDAAVSNLLELWDETRLDNQGRVVLDRVPAEGHALAEQRQREVGVPADEAHYVVGAVERAFLDMDYFGKAPGSAGRWRAG